MSQKKKKNKKYKSKKSYTNTLYARHWYIQSYQVPPNHHNRLFNTIPTLEESCAQSPQACPPSASTCSRPPPVHHRSTSPYASYSNWIRLFVRSAHWFGFPSGIGLPSSSAAIAVRMASSRARWSGPSGRWKIFWFRREDSCVAVARVSLLFSLD